MQILTLVPVYNEWPHLLYVLRDLRNYTPEILVIDDGSYDKSFLAHLREEGFNYLSFAFNLGHWNAVQAGFRYALHKNYPAAVTFDGDGQHLAEELYKLAAQLRLGCDLVIGGNHARGGFSRRMVRVMLKTLSGLDVVDFTSGFRGYSRRAMQSLIDPSFSNLEYQDLGVLFMARQKGLRMLELPVRMKARVGKKSRVFPGFPAMLRYFMITLTFVLARRP